MSKKSELLGADLPLKPADRPNQPAPVRAFQPPAEMTADQKYSLQRIRALAGGKAAKIFTPAEEAILHAFSMSSDAGTGDDAFLWLKNNKLSMGYSTVRSGINYLTAKGLIEPADMPSHAVRPGPRTGYYRITGKGRRALKASGELLRVLEDA